MSWFFALGSLMIFGMLLGVGAVCASDALLPAWEVGQERVSPADLEVIVPPPAPEELSLEDAISTALSQNLSFRRAFQNLLAARSNWYVVQQRWSLDAFALLERTESDGTVDSEQYGAAFSYAATTGADFSVVAEIDRLENEETESERLLTAFLRQPLLAGRGDASAAYEQVRQARNSYRAELVSFYVSRQDLVERVISAYFATIQEEQLVEIQELSVTLAEQAVEEARLRLEAGLIPEFDLTSAQLRLAREQTAAVTQRQGYRDSMDSFLVLLGLDVGGAPELVTTVPYEPETLALEDLVQQALALRPDLRLADLLIEDREAALRIDRSQRLPSLDLIAGWTREENGVEESSWSVGLDLSVPIASRSLSEAVRRSRWALLVSQQAKEDLKQEVMADVRRQVRAAEAAQANVKIATQSLEVAQRSLHIAERMVEEGLRTNRDLLDAQDDLTRSQTSLVTSKISYFLALVRLRVAVGLPILPEVKPKAWAEAKSDHMDAK
ncbi:MAG: TolC family protein [Armatimonadetes bacterium]|nr:TolC family protein [Armatimonadota bacterium]